MYFGECFCWPSRCTRTNLVENYASLVRAAVAVRRGGVVRVLASVVAEGGQLGDGDVVFGGEGLHPLRTHQRGRKIRVHGERHHLIANETLSQSVFRVLGIIFKDCFGLFLTHGFLKIVASMESMPPS